MWGSRGRWVLSIGLLGALCGCQPLDDKVWKIWNARQLASIANDGKSIVGMPASFLVATVKTGVPFRGAEYEPVAQAVTADGPAMLPAFAEGGTAAYFVTEAWQNAARPLVQPVYMFVSRFDAAAPPSQRVQIGGDPRRPVPNVFGVGAFNAFSSPYWQMQFTVAKDPASLGPDTVTDVRKVMANQTEVHPGPLVGCPFIPGQVTLADARGLRPLSFESLKQLKRPGDFDEVRHGYAEGAPVDYLDFGPETFQVDAEGRVVPTHIYFFVGAEKKHLKLPAVLAADARSNALADRVDVQLDRTFEVFVPSGSQWAAVRSGLEEGGVRAFDHGNTTPEAGDPRLALRVAKRAGSLGDGESCFAAGPPPGPCAWVDSEAAVLAQTTPGQRVDPGVQLSVWTMLFNGAIP